MTKMTNCEWMHSKLEAYFTDQLPSEELQTVRQHLAACADCRRQVDSYTDIDSMVRGVFNRRMAVAQLAANRNTRPRWVRLAVAGTAVTVAAVLLVIGMTFFQQTPELPVAVQPPSVPSVQPEIKKDDVEEIRLAKPDDEAPAETAVAPSFDRIDSDAPEFVLTDPAGYTTTLETYRGRPLLFGVVSADQKKAVAGLQQMYESLGTNGGLRILGVSRRHENAFEGATFPILSNHGSKLLGVADGHFLLLDSNGEPRLEGSLTDSKAVSRVRTELEQKGTR